jgi:copper chaperone NosL
MIRIAAAGVIGIAGVVAACSPGPVPIAYGDETCARCMMGISDTRFGAELVTSTGKVHKFDSIECLATFYDETDAPRSVRSLWVTNFASPGEFLPAAGAAYLVESRFNSPMGLSVVAFSEDVDADSITAAFGGRVVDWEEVRIRVRSSGHLHGGGRPPDASSE